MKTLIFGTLITIAISGLGCSSGKSMQSKTSSSSNPAVSPAEAITVSTAKAQRQDLVNRLDLTATITAYEQAIQSYPGTNSVPVAYYKLGLTHQRLGQIQQAQAAWEAAAKNFPDSDAGRLARQSLERLKTTEPAR